MADDPFPDGMVEEIEAFLEADTAPPGQDLYDAVFATATMFPLQRKAEMRRMMHLARQGMPRVVFEIGTDKAGSLFHWCKCLPTVTRVIACEIRGVPYAEAFTAAFPEIDFLWLPQSSFDPETVNGVEDWLDGDLIDRLFLDGDKSFFLADFDAYLPLMAYDGIVFLHDITDPTPGDAFEEIKKRGFRTQTIIDRDEWREVEQRGGPRTAHEHWLKTWCGKSCGVGVVYV